jgi:hypothetical protein
MLKAVCFFRKPITLNTRILAKSRELQPLVFKN